MIDYGGYSTNKHLAKIQKSLGGITSVKAARHNLSEIFTLIFREQFIIDMPIDAFREGIGVTRSNWTYHTALSVRTSARLLALKCRFETHGRLDALIETMQEKPKPVLLAVWEWNYQDIFGKDKELEKLRTGLRKLRGADGFLLTYCPTVDYLNFVKRVLKYWQQGASGTNYPLLYLVVIAYQQRDALLEFQYMRTIQIFPREIVLWDDIPFT
jgi:hypothetical protein